MRITLKNYKSAKFPGREARTKSSNIQIYRPHWKLPQASFRIFYGRRYSLRLRGGKPLPPAFPCKIRYGERYILLQGSCKAVPYKSAQQQLILLSIIIIICFPLFFEILKEREEVCNFRNFHSIFVTFLAVNVHS